MGIIEVNPEYKQKCIVNIKSVNFLFNEKVNENGFIAYDDLGNRAFYYPIRSNPNISPITFLQECILMGKNDFRNIIINAYKIKSHINIDNQIVLWGEYESLFSRQPFYLGKPEKAKII